VLTLFAEDRPGVVNEVSDTILEHGGNWLESSLSRLCGQFAGIVHVGVLPGKHDDLLASLAALSSNGIHITAHEKVTEASDAISGTVVELIVEANDRQGIIEEISSALAEVDVNVEQMETSCHSASMAGYELFIAHLFVALPDGFNADQLEGVLEGVSDDLMVSLVEVE